MNPKPIKDCFFLVIEPYKKEFYNTALRNCAESQFNTIFLSNCT